ncbi:hypothetical protein [Pseudoxanthomonas suwonensis]|uniref:hypothetical protein n=1 Tax=Pseudoxanthomonas suwonensis TaxID=314722 RepID=UPI0004B3F12A|nr:hypothetical protein [Pseudoxanthomonas suwonensis]
MKQHRAAGRGSALAPGIAAGVALGAVFGIALDNLALGIGPGIALSPGKDGDEASGGTGEDQDGT